MIDDYAHHPTEVAATLEAARQAFPKGRVHAVFQPHLYSRTKDLAEDFGSALLEADHAIVTAIYPSREQPIAGVTSELVVDAARRHGHRHVVRCEHWSEAFELLQPSVADGDVVLTLGAGDINRLGEQLCQESTAGGSAA